MKNQTNWEMFDSLRREAMMQAMNDLAKELFIMYLKDGHVAKAAAEMAFSGADAYYKQYKIKNEIV